ncbi:MAG: ABC transporter ATP-binding protein [Pseudomonadales bacterium]|jgi:putative ABC transport system ATP-binding protein|nr:ABC transporter ATP-binding protein [Pseudomonadales bacterium]
MIIETEQLTKLYRTTEVETAALDGIALKVKQGEFVSIMGPSGCGKSTLLHLLGLIDTPSGGVYRFLGEDVAKYKEERRAPLRRANIGFVFQNFNLIDELTVYENVDLALQYNKASNALRKPRVNEVLEQVGMSHRARHFPQQLSGGQQQRVAVARAIVNRPNVIMADEPTGNLDSERGDEVMQLLSELNAAGATVVMVTHSADNARFGNRIVKLLDGMIVSQIAPAA